MVRPHDPAAGSLQLASARARLAVRPGPDARRLGPPVGNVRSANSFAFLVAPTGSTRNGNNTGPHAHACVAG